MGTLVLNIYDPAVKRLVWKGFATKEINLSKNQQKNRRNLDKATQKLLKDFPPKRTQLLHVSPAVSGSSCNSRVAIAAGFPLDTVCSMQSRARREGARN
jgi:hypothetical protein